MNVEDFRKHGKDMIDYICSYAANIEQRDVAPTLDPGYLKQLLPGRLETKVKIKNYEKKLIIIKENAKNIKKKNYP